MTAAKKNQPAGFLDQPWPYGYVSRPVLWAVSVWGVAVAAHGLRIEALYLIGVGALLAVLAAFAAPDGTIDGTQPSESKHAAPALFAFVLGAAITTYVTWFATGTPFQRNAALALIPGAAIFGVWWEQLTFAPTDKDARRIEQQMAAAVASANLPQILANAGFKGIKPDGPVETFDAGTTQRLLLPANGSIDYTQLQAATRKIEIAARAKFPIRFAPGDHIAQVVGIMLDRDVLAETLPYPIDRAAKSIHDPMPLGKDEMGVVQYVTFRELSAMFVGERGSGKSALINSHLAYLTGCKDALVWMIDGKGGRTVRPWLQPFLDGLGKPAIDWPATDPEEADYVLLAARELVAHRSRGEGEQVHPTPGQPAVILIVEEASIITGVGSSSNSARANLAKDTVVLGRSEAVDVILVAQRGTVTMLGSGDMKSQLQYIVGLGISKLEDAVRIFGQAGMARQMLRYATELAYRGVMLVKAPGWKTVLPVKGWLLEQSQIPGVALTNAAHQPVLETDAVAHLDHVLELVGCTGGYSGRWDRFAGGLSHGAGRSGGHDTPAGVSHGTAQTAVHDTPGGASHDTGDDTPRERPKIGPTYAEDLIAKVKAERQAKAEEARFKEITDTVWDAANDTWRDTPDVPELTWNPEVIPPVLGCLMSLFHGTGDEYLTTAYILDQPTFASLTPKRLGVLAAHCGFGPVQNLTDDAGKRVRGYSRLDVARAFNRAQREKMPDAAFQWRP